MIRKCPVRGLSFSLKIQHNTAMEKLIQTLQDLGLPPPEVQRIQIYYEGDEAGLREYVLYMRAVLDDRHEYV